jgi:hypothetical protein
MGLVTKAPLPQPAALWRRLAAVIPAVTAAF